MALDIEGALDCVWYSVLVSKLRADGIGGSLLQLLRNLNDFTDIPESGS